MVKSYSFEAEKTERADKLICGKIPELSRSYVQKLIEEGQITVNGKMIKANYKTKAGDRIDVVVPDPKTISLEPQKIDLDIVYEDDCLLVINKPRNMVVHPAAGNYDNTLVNAILYHCKGKLSGINGEIRPGIVHRLDKDTTGLLVAAKDDETHKALSEQLKHRTLFREYYALVHGNIKEDSFVIDAPIGRDDKDRKKMAVKKSGNAREAITNVLVIERFLKYTLVSCRLKTGRTHQIRVHMKYKNHPVVGDKVYGIKDEFNLEGQLLHAKTIGFIHPKTKEYMEFSAPLPQDFSKVLDLLRKRDL
ncbi:MAG: RluA family pseudouridine synthase [Clostridiaceae bacterium]|nr:RluA family pseudouridine synthase [Clostridiaceae bacterium]